MIIYSKVEQLYALIYYYQVRRNYFRLGDSLAQLKIDLEKLNEHSNTEVGIMKIPRVSRLIIIIMRCYYLLWYIQSVLQLDKKILETEKEFKQMEEQFRISFTVYLSID